MSAFKSLAGSIIQLKASFGLSFELSNPSKSISLDSRIPVYRCYRLFQKVAILLHLRRECLWFRASPMDASLTPTIDLAGLLLVVVIHAGILALRLGISLSRA